MFDFLYPLLGLIALVIILFVFIGEMGYASFAGYVFAGVIVTTIIERVWNNSYTSRS
jgi:hypothetical protein